MVHGFLDGEDAETLGIGKRVFKTTDWTRADIVFRIEGMNHVVLFVDIPGSPSIILEQCKQRDVHIQPRLFQ